MTVLVTTADDTPGLDAAGMIVVRFQFPDCLSLTPGQLRGWWKTVETEAAEKFRAWVADPPAPTPRDDDATAVSVMVPIPLNMFCAPGFDLVDEVIPQVKDAAIMGIFHGRGDHSTCWDQNECRREQRRAKRGRQTA
jgi:hypothetical protein